MLTPCTACGRHVRSGAAACPFCDAPLVYDEIVYDEIERMRPRVVSRSARNALLTAVTAAGGTLALRLMAGCFPVYGGPPVHTHEPPPADGTPCEDGSESVWVEGHCGKPCKTSGDCDAGTAGWASCIAARNIQGSYCWDPHDCTSDEDCALGLVCAPWKCNPEQLQAGCVDKPDQRLCFAPSPAAVGVPRPPKALPAASSSASSAPSTSGN